MASQWPWFVVAYVVAGIVFAELLAAGKRRLREKTPRGAYVLAMILWPFVLFFAIRPRKKPGPWGPRN